MGVLVDLEQGAVQGRDDEHAHAHPGGVAAAASAGTSQTDHLHGTSDPADHHGDQHMTFCLEKSLLPAAGVSVLPLLWLMLIGSAVVAAVVVLFPGNAQAIRGPPRTGPPALNGQAVLTNFCISRR